MEQPKLSTPHYNQNGKNVYTRRFTIFVFASIMLYVMFIVTMKIIPIFSSFWAPELYVSTTLETEQLTNSLGLAGNDTANNTGGFYH